MKKHFGLLAILAVGMFLITGCGGGTATKPTAEEIKGELDNAPAWVLDPMVDGDIAAIGSAKVGKAGMQLARTEALTNARQEMATMMSGKIQSIVKNFAQATGIGDAETVDKVSSQTTRQITNETLSGSRQKNLWASPSGDIYVLVTLDPKVTKQAVKDAIESSYKNDAALWQQFQSKKAFEELDQQIEKEFNASKK